MKKFITLLLVPFGLYAQIACTDSQQKEIPNVGFKKKVHTRALIESTDSIFSFQDFSTTYEERMTGMANEDSVYWGFKSGKFFSKTNCKMQDLSWCKNGSKDSLVQELKNLSIHFTRTQFFILSYELEKDSVGFYKSGGYSLWYK